MLSLKLGRFIVGLTKRAQNFQFFVFNIFFIGLFFTVSFFSIGGFSSRFAMVYFARIWGSTYFGLFPGKPMILPLQEFHLTNSDLLDYHSRQIGCYRLINYHTNVILTVSFSHMNLAKTNI